MSKKHTFKRCVVIINPVSSNTTRGRRYIRQLADMFPAKHFEMLEVSNHDYVRPSWLITRLNAALDKDTLLAIAGGDGTNNLIVDTLLRSSSLSKVARKVTILPLWAGNANDLAHMANGAPPSNIASVIKTGSIVKIYPLAVTTKHAYKSTTKLAICYVSLGASGYVSARISHPSHRRKRLYRLPGGRNLTDVASVTRGFIGASTFESTINDTKRRIYDVAMINGSRMAKVNWIPIKLTDKNFYEILIVRKHPLIVSYFVQLMRGISVERRTHTERSLSISEPTWAQIDGEPVQIPGDTDINVKPYDQPFYLLSTKLSTS